MAGFARHLLVLAALLLAAAGSARADTRTDYLLYCRGCHLANGEGVPPVVPTLHDLGPLVATPTGREYIIRVPGVAQTEMNDTRLTAVLNWVLQEFNANTLPDDFKPYSVQEVSASRYKVLTDPVRTRAEILTD